MEKSILGCAAAIVCVLTLSAPALPQDPPTKSALSPQVVEIAADKYEFTPAEVHVRKGTFVRLKVKSVDKAHGLKLNAYPEGASQTGPPGLHFEQSPDTGKVKKDETGDLIFLAEKPGVYEFKCSVVCGFGHGRMKGKLIVDE
jgi:cytochrome c oxidase subunit 2